MSVWLEYEERETLMHDLHPFTKVALVLTGAFLSGIWWDPRYLIPLLLFALGLTYLARVPLGWFKPISVLVMALIPTTAARGIFQTNPDLFTVYSDAFVSTTIASIQVPLIGTAGLTYGTILWMTAFITKLVIIAMFVYSFLYSTRLGDLSQAVTQYVPQQVGYVLIVSLKFIPYMIRRVQTIYESQRLRGLTISIRNPRGFVRGVIGIGRPIFRLIFRTIEEITIASQLRGFGNTENITQVREIPVGARDKAIVAGCGCAVAAAAVGLVFFQSGLL